jgi:hypothetical protein
LRTFRNLLGKGEDRRTMPNGYVPPVGLEPTLAVV